MQADQRQKDMQDEILSMLIEKDEITWKTIIQNLIKTGEIDPWDVDISILTKKYLKILKKLKEMDLRIPGKVLLAAALLLRIKSTKLIDEDITEFDRLIASTEMNEDEFYSDLESDMGDSVILDSEVNPVFSLTPRTPQPRKRKVSIYDLINALEKAFEVKKRRVVNNLPPTSFKLPEKSTDVTFVIRSVYKQIVSFFKQNNNNLTFTQLIPSESKLDKVYTFIPLLHLDNQRRIEMIQKKHFGEITINLLKNARTQEVEEELGLA